MEAVLRYCSQSVACLQNAISFSLSFSLLSYQFVHMYTV